MAQTQSRRLPPGGTQDPRFIAEVVNGIKDGRIDSVGSVTLVANTAQTTLTDVRLSENSVPILQPCTANAAVANQTAHVVVSNGSLIIHHASDAQVDKTFKYAILGN